MDNIIALKCQLVIATSSHLKGGRLFVLVEMKRKLR